MGEMRDFFFPSWVGWVWVELALREGFIGIDGHGPGGEHVESAFPLLRHCPCVFHSLCFPTCIALFGVFKRKAKKTRNGGQ